jgi:hypothetical protein
LSLSSCQQGRQVEEDPDDYNKRGTVHRLKKVAVEKIQRSNFLPGQALSEAHLLIEIQHTLGVKGIVFLSKHISSYCGSNAGR